MTKLTDAFINTGMSGIQSEKIFSIFNHTVELKKENISIQKTKFATKSVLWKKEC